MVGEYSSGGGGYGSDREGVYRGYGSGGGYSRGTGYGDGRGDGGSHSGGGYSNTYSYGSGGGSGGGSSGGAAFGDGRNGDEREKSRGYRGDSGSGYRGDAGGNSSGWGVPSDGPSSRSAGSPAVSGRNDLSDDALNTRGGGKGHHARARGAGGGDSAPGSLRSCQVDPFARAAREQVQIDGVYGVKNAIIDFETYHNLPVVVTGARVPAPITSFDAANFPPALVHNIRRCKYTNPTPIQKYATPIAMAGRDVMSCAQTGSGKTAAFLLPMISKLLTSNRAPSRHSGVAQPLALIMAPTRELTCQIFDEACKFTDETGLKPVVVYGGFQIDPQVAELRRGCDLLVGTPGRLSELMERGHILLYQIHCICLDEADRMLDMGFKRQTHHIMDRQDMPRPGARQMTMSSATFPKTVQKLAGDMLSSNYVFITVGRVGSSIDLIAQHVEYVDPVDKRRTLLDLISVETGLTLVFVGTRREARRLTEFLIQEGVRATAIHSDRTQEEREAALCSFKSGGTPVMVATDVVARGLDIPRVTHVINYDMPNEHRGIDMYVQRIGRTGHAGQKGMATAFFSGGDSRLSHLLIEVLSETNQTVPEWLREIASSDGVHACAFVGMHNFGGRDLRHKYSRVNRIGVS